MTLRRSSSSSSRGTKCNFSCPYCYQEGYEPDAGTLRPEVTDAFFSYVASRFAGRKAYITLFGGEPLLPGRKSRDAVTHFFSAAGRAGLDTAVVTNGYTLPDYVDVLKASAIREVQVTLDGVGPLHDRRRPLKGGGSTFERVVAGVEACLGSGLPVNLRVVLDRENIDGLPGLARFAVERGWTANPLFKTQLGRNYELHTCQAAPANLYTRVELYEKIYGLVAGHPEILELHKPAFSFARFLFENGELPAPLFDSCPGCKSEWAFDYTGRIYACTATVGKKGKSSAHTFRLSPSTTGASRSGRSGTSPRLPSAGQCSQQLACGGGCGEVARNRTGRLLAPDCRPVRELLSLGMALYSGKEEPQ